MTTVLIVPSPYCTMKPLVLLLGLLLMGCRSYEPSGTVIDPPMDVPAFTLVGEDGEASRDDFAGSLLVLFFGFTRCPDVCPDTMARLARAVGKLSDRDARQVRVALISVDPDRDPPARIAEYARAFHPDFVGLTGTDEQIGRVTSAYGIYRAPVAYEDRDGYTVDHTAHVLVLDRSGRTVLIWSPGTEPEAMAADLRHLLRSS